VLVELNLPTAIQQGLVECLWRGNGKERLSWTPQPEDSPLRLHLSAGNCWPRTIPPSNPEIADARLCLARGAA